MSCVTSIGAHVFMTMYLLLMTGCVAQKVYFECGAKVDVVDVQGLILSPGFPYNYSSGTHCVWQFFVPVDYQLILEIFDFDVFESHDSDSAQYTGLSSFEEEAFTPDSLAAEETPPSVKAPDPPSEAGVPAALLPRQQDKVKQVVVQEESTKMEIAKLSNSAKRSTDASSDLNATPPRSLLLLPGAQPPGDKGVNSVSSYSLLRGDPNPPAPLESATAVPSRPTDTPPASPETQQAAVDACPHDVLYISDLITFSSRFCGSNRPPSSQLVFGSSQEMVEVIMELITTTHWGRGFALLFHYHNRTEPRGERQVYAPTASKVDSLLAAVSGAAFFAMILTGALCVIFRPKLCPKRASSCVSNNSESPEGIQSAEAEVNELQLVAANQACLQVHSEQTHSLTPRVGADYDMSHNIEVELSSGGLTELDLGADEVFVASSAPSPTRLSFSPHTQRERFLRHSDTGPSSMNNWPDPAASPTGTRSAKDSSSVSARPRAWSVRTFQDLLPPLPQLHKKWCSWNSASPFTKLVDSAPSSLVADDTRKVFSDTHLEVRADGRPTSDSSISNASYPLTQPAQRQRRLNSTSNLRRARFAGPLFGGPCFGLLSGTSDLTKPSGIANTHPPPSEAPLRSSSSQLPSENSQARKRREFPAEGDHISVPVFAISEEEDRQPLVLAEHVVRAFATQMPNGAAMRAYEGGRPDMGSARLSPQNQASSPYLQRAGPEWKLCGSQESSSSTVGEAKPPSVVNTVMDTHPSLSQSTVPCSVPGKEM